MIKLKDSKLGKIVLLTAWDSSDGQEDTLLSRHVVIMINVDRRM